MTKKSDDDMQNPCIVRSEDDFRDAPEAPSMDVEEVPEDPIDNLRTLTLTSLKTPLRRGDIGLVDLLTPKVELLNRPLLSSVE